MITQTINLDMTPGGVCPVIHVSQYDKDDNALVFNLYQGSTPFTAGTTATIEGTKPDKTGFTYAASYSDNTVTADLTEQMTALSGAVMCEIRITDGDNTVGTQNFILMVEPAALADDTVISDTDIPLLQQAIDAAATAVTAASTVYGVGTKISGTDDLNTYTTSGKYYAEASHSISNAPIGGGFVMLVYYTYNQYRCVQIVVGMDGSLNVRALYQNNTWTGWWKSSQVKTLGGKTQIASATNFNNITSIGEYYFNSTVASGSSNCPITLGGKMTVEASMGIDDTNVRQTVMRYNTAADIYTRVYYYNSQQQTYAWSNWYKLTATDTGA